MDFCDVIKARHSVRYFEPTPIDIDLLMQIVKDAQTAPSWVNAQEWRVWIATGKTLEAIREEFIPLLKAEAQSESDLPQAHRGDWSEMAQNNMATFSQSRIDAGLLEAKLEAQSHLFHAPAVIYLTIPKKHSDWAVLDLGGFEQTLLLAAANRGLGTVPAFNLVRYPDIIRRHMGIDDSDALAIGIAIGYEADHPLNHFRSSRLATESIVVIKD